MICSTSKNDIAINEKLLYGISQSKSCRIFLMNTKKSIINGRTYSSNCGDSQFETTVNTPKNMKKKIIFFPLFTVKFIIGSKNASIFFYVLSGFLLPQDLKINSKKPNKNINLV